MTIKNCFRENKLFYLLPSVYLNMSTYVHLEPSGQTQTVALGIIGTDLYFACRKDGEEPTLHLEVKTI